MKTINLLIAVKNIKKNFWLLFSSVAAMCLYLSLSFVSVVFFAVVFSAIVVAAAFGVTKPSTMTIRDEKKISLLLTVLLGVLGFFNFNTTWAYSSKIAKLLETIDLDLSTSVFLLLVGSIGMVVAFYALYVLSRWIVCWLVYLIKKHLLIHRRTEMIENLKRNWYFLVSAIMFFFLAIDVSFDYCVGLVFVVGIMLIITSQIPSVWRFVTQHTAVSKTLCFFSAIGICLGNQEYCYKMLLKHTANISLLERADDLFLLMSYFGGIGAMFFAFFCLLVFWKKMKQIVSETGLVNDINRKEWSIYALLIAVFIGFMVFSFTQSQVFYRTGVECDVIYTSDSPLLVKNNVYLALTHPENDLRQPLFAVFAAPFTGLPYLIGRGLDVSKSVQAMLMNSTQVLMLFFANFMLAKMLKFSARKRICFMILTSCTYTHLLFSLMMEQYIVGYFWLILCMYLIVEKQKPDRIALWGASGTLLTSMILLPSMSDKSPIKEFKGWFMDMAKYGLEFVVLILLFCRFDVIFNFMSKLSFLSSFSGKNVAFTDKIYQYTGFISSCFIAPDAGVNTTTFDHISWQMNVATEINVVGVIILVLAVISSIWNRDKKSSLLAIGWIGFSVVMLLGLGWGTKENGLILYALYFGWAFLVLLFQLVEKIEDKLNITFLIPVTTIGVGVLMLAINIPKIMEMLNFAITYYPA